jgi:hypothetical protein
MPTPNDFARLDFAPQDGSYREHSGERGGEFGRKPVSQLTPTLTSCVPTAWACPLPLSDRIPGCVTIWPIAPPGNREGLNPRPRLAFRGKGRSKNDLRP